MKYLVRSAVLAATLLTTSTAFAHRSWMIPSATVLAGDDAWVCIDGARSNTLFHADHNALRTENAVAIAPDGSRVKPENMMRARYRSTFDVHLTQQGTYRIVNNIENLVVRYKLDGQDKTWRGTPATFKGAIPEHATDIKVRENYDLVETFATLGAPTMIKPLGQGLELMPVTHPTDLVTGEPARFRFLIDGKPARDLKVLVVPGGARYRQGTEEIPVTTDAAGEFTVKWSTPGLWWISTRTSATARHVPDASAGMSYAGVVEVLPP